MAPNISSSQGQAANETSPLLRKPSHDDVHVIATESGVTTGNEIADPEDGGEVERQISRNGDTSKHQGMPELKKRMKYIFPAIAIGVSHPRTLYIQHNLHDNT